MNRRYVGLLLALLVLLPVASLAQWSPLQPLSSTSHPARLKYNFGRAIDVDGAGLVHAAWLEEVSADPAGHGTGRVMYSRSGDDGRNWSIPISLTGSAQPVTGHPRVAASGPHVYVTWHGLHDGSGMPKIYLLHSSTHGASWDSPRIISDNPNASSGTFWPSIDACGEAVHVVWADAREGVPEIYLRSSSDAGRSWTAVGQVSSPDGRSSWVPAVACWDRTVHVAWSDERHNVKEGGEPYDCGLASDTTQCREEEYYRRSTDFGESWDDEIRLTVDPPNFPRSSWAPSIAVWGDTVHVVFFDRRTDRFQIYYMRSTGGGASFTWEPERRISVDYFGAPDHARPVIAALGPYLHVVWFAITPPIGVHVFHAGSSDNGASFGAPLPLTLRPSLGEAHPSVAVSPRRSAHVIWYEPDAHGVDQIVHRAQRALGPTHRLPWD